MRSRSENDPLRHFQSAHAQVVGARRMGVESMDVNFLVASALGELLGK
ncbi:MAG: hypothetical protein IPN34_20210 [Planctomycetes bacterium]|nr:hypothetical protein [Planctomycetota bacterium]